MQWDIAYMQLEKAETTFEAASLLERPEHNLRCCGCSGNSCSPLFLVTVSTLYHLWYSASLFSSANTIPVGKRCALHI